MRDNLQFFCSHLCCSHFTKCKTKIFRMTDSMNFGPDWIRNLSSEGTTGGGSSGGTRYQLADYRYGREEMLALFDKNVKPPVSLSNFKCLYSDICLQPLALLPTTDEERGWQPRPNAVPPGPLRGRGGSLERGGRISRGRGYQYGRLTGGYDSGWGNGEQTEWSPRKEYINQRTTSDNWRRARNDEDDGWRSTNTSGPGRSSGHEKWGRSTSWRGEGDSEERTGPPERGGRTSWNDNRAPLARKSWESEDHLPEWATENPTEGGGTFDEKGAFHGSDDEQPEGKPHRKEMGLQKSTSQQHISTKSQPPPITSSKSTLSLVKDEETIHKKEVLEENQFKEIEDVSQNGNKKDHVEEKKKSDPSVPEKIDKTINVQERAKSEGPPKLTKNSDNPPVIPNGSVNEAPRPDDSDFERLQEDLVLKLVVDEEVPKQIPNNFEVSGVQPPPNLAAPTVVDKWFYQDPQGQMQGPFSNIEMAEWYKAGYFSNQLKVRRQCDERFFLLGELITLCGGVNPFLVNSRFPVLKNDITKVQPEPDIMQLQYLSQMAAFKQAQARLLTEPWTAISIQQQQELAAQRLILQQQQQQVSQDLQYLQQPPATNPLMHMINQMQQANKLPGQGLVDKQSQNIPGTLDPHLQLHMTNLLSMQNRLPTTALPNNLPAGLGNSIPGNIPQPEGLPTSISSLQTPSLNTGGIPIPGMQSNIPVSIGGNINMPRPTSRGSVEQISSNPSNDPITCLLKQLQQQKQPTPPQIDSLWQQNSFASNNSTPQWQSQTEAPPISMWELQNNSVPTAPSPPLTQSEKLQQALQPKPSKADKEKEQKQKEEVPAKELKKKKELEEKQAKKEAEEKRKQEQKRLEAEKKASEEKRKKEDERIKRELEKAKKEAEEKRMRELEEKRKLKEQRKAEEEAKKRSEEQKKLEEERIRQELKDRELRRLEEEKRLQQEQLRLAKAAPWTQANANMGLSLAEIQKAEREKKAIDAALHIQRIQEKEQQQQLQQEKNQPSQFNWANKPVEPRKVKSLAEIQAEEQEKLAKQAAETRLQKEKEPLPVVNNTSSSIWSNQNLTWASASTNWSASSGGFWDDSSSKQQQQQQGVHKPSTVSKNNSTNNISAAPKPQQQKPAKNVKTKKDESNKTNHNNNGPSTDDFMNWCYKTLSNISTNVDIPTFVTFLRDIESAFDVKEYCKEYLGDNNATHQFAVNFLEKRRSFKPRNNAHKDDMCSPAPAITPSLQHSTEFQEVKGKNKKIKKSKMLKVDARILGFNVTSAPDRINVGDRDYGDNS
ncbi:GRB10-interacting GYF protein 2 isoform X1 [Diorhabda sublineata]|uniref:GRB10-interacting GYF protein 2 isoform X1 n=1 Tax=Diorhabda sublineata TaxID=1163346 RepID=UPI0024E13551|nr:GRB10-interacting GYF protein 2 isoform X1 [Diorhabda sublineata]